MIEPVRVVVVGAGGVGGWLLESVCRILNNQAPDSMVVVVDGDQYEAKNHDRQDFDQYGNKAEVKVAGLAPKFNNIFMISDARWVVDDTVVTDENAVQAAELLNEGDVVFAVVDNHAARKTIFDAAMNLENVDVFTGGNDDALFGSVYHYSRKNGLDVTDHPAKYHEEFENPPDRNPALLSCEERAALDGGSQTIAANMLVAGFLTARFTKTIIDGQEDMEAEIMFDASVGLSQPYDRTVDEAKVPALTKG